MRKTSSPFRKALNNLDQCETIYRSNKNNADHNLSQFLDLPDENEDKVYWIKAVNYWEVELNRILRAKEVLLFGISSITPIERI